MSGGQKDSHPGRRTRSASESMIRRLHSYLEGRRLPYILEREDGALVVQFGRSVRGCPAPG